jgi:hypothetical protein
LGEAVMPLAVLNKLGRLAEDEFRTMKTHPERGHALLVERAGRRGKGHVDIPVFQAFVKTVGICPVGAQNPQALLTPKVKAFFSTKSNLRIEPLEIDLSRRGCKGKVVACESPSKWPFKDLDLPRNSSPLR